MFTFYFLIYFWLCWVLVAEQCFSLVVESGGCSPVASYMLLIVVISLAVDQSLGCWASVVVAPRL